MIRTSNQLKEYMVRATKAKTVKATKGEVVNSKSRPTTILLAAVSVAIIGVIAGVAIYRDRIAPFRMSVIEVDNASITMRYFLERVRIAGGEPLAMLGTLTKEEIIKQVAPKPPYNIALREEDIDRFFKEIARGKSDTISESDFKEWYRQQLNESRLSNTELRDLMRTNLLIERLTEYLVGRVPSVAEHVHLYMIAVEDFAEAERVKERLDAGEDFGKVAREVSSDEVLKKNGGELGWFPRGALPPDIAQAAFDEFAIGKSSEPLYLDEKHFTIIMVSEKVAVREIDEDSRQRIKARALDEWLKEEQQYHKIKFHGFKDGYDSETDTWVKWQLRKIKR
jgi:foldase protein PrsA